MPTVAWPQKVWPVLVDMHAPQLLAIEFTGRILTKCCREEQKTTQDVLRCVAVARAAHVMMSIICIIAALPE